jgi:hypothetical protein
MCSSYCVFRDVTKVESSDHEGNDTHVSFKTYRKKYQNIVLNMSTKNAQFSALSHYFRTSNFFSGLSTTDETLVVEMRIWCIKIGNVFALHNIHCEFYLCTWNIMGWGVVVTHLSIKGYCCWNTWTGGDGGWYLPLCTGDCGQNTLDWGWWWVVISTSLHRGLWSEHYRWMWGGDTYLSTQGTASGTLGLGVRLGQCSVACSISLTGRVVWKVKCTEMLT